MVKTDILREKITNFALEQLNKPYIHGYHGPDFFDCAGLVWYIYHEICDIDLYHAGIGKSTTTKIMTGSYGKLTLFNEFDKYKDINLIKEGDILFFHRQSKDDNIPRIDNKYPGHVAIYIGNHKFIHTTIKSKKVIITSFDKNKYWSNVLVGTKDVISNIKVLKKSL